MGCNCGGGAKRDSGARSLRGGQTGTPRGVPTRVAPAVPTPTERRLLEMQAQARQASPAPIGDVRLEQERQRRLAVLRALGHA